MTGDHIVTLAAQTLILGKNCATALSAQFYLKLGSDFARVTMSSAVIGSPGIQMLQ